MIRRVICVLLRFALRIYFRRIEVAGLEHVPRDSPVIFVLNHPNALVDPVFLLCLTPRRVSFLAKAPLFRMPVLGFLVRALDSLPVYRSQDEGEDISKNRETFVLARKLLSRGGTLGICPEGVSHDEPRLKPLKTGAARIALGTVSGADSLNLKIVPAGLFYTAKTRFRSAALLYFGQPIDVEPVELDSAGNPPRGATRVLSDRIERALRDVILEAEHKEALALIEKAERMFFSDEGGKKDERSLARELQMRRQFLDGYAFHQPSPQTAASVPRRMRVLKGQELNSRPDPRSLSPPPSSWSDTRAPKPLMMVFLCCLLRYSALLFTIPLTTLGITCREGWRGIQRTSSPPSRSSRRCSFFP